MSFETVSGGNKMFASKIEAPLVAYFKDARQDEVKNKFGNHNMILDLVLEDGTETELVTVGTLNYVAKNVLISRGQMDKPENLKEETVAKDVELVGHLIRISPAGTYQSKGGKEIKKFQIEVDRSKKLKDFKAPEKSKETSEDIPF